VGGYVSNRIGPTRLFGLAAGPWSIVCGATAFVTGLGQLVVFRMRLGIGRRAMPSRMRRLPVGPREWQAHGWHARTCARSERMRHA